MYIYGLKEDCKLVLDGNKEKWSRIIESYNFKLLAMPFVKLLLASDDLTLTEEELWDASIKWSKYRFDKEHSTDGTHGSLDTSSSGGCAALFFVGWRGVLRSGFVLACSTKTTTKKVITFVPNKPTKQRATASGMKWNLKTPTKEHFEKKKGRRGL